MIVSAPKNMFVAKMGKNGEYGEIRMRKNMMANCFFFLILEKINSKKRELLDYNL